MTLHPPDSFVSALAHAQDVCPDGDWIRLHRPVPDAHSDHVDDPACWCQPIRLNPKDAIDAAAVYREVCKLP